VTAWGGGNNEFQLYTQDPANSYVSDGKLYIKPSLLIEATNPKTKQPYGEAFMTNGVLDLVDLYGTCTNANNGGCYRLGEGYNNIPPIMSARLRSYRRFSYTHGRAVVRAKMPVGDWTWPAIWMLPENWEYGDWPMSGEIDIIEAIGNRNFKAPDGEFVGVQKMGSTLHWGPRWDVNRYYLTTAANVDIDNNYGDNFHTFIFDWSPNGLRFFVDDEDTPILEVPYPLVEANPNWVDFWTYGAPWPTDVSNPWTSGTNLAPFDKDFHFILNVATGGTNGFIPDGCVNQDGNPSAQKPWSNGDSYVDAMRKFYDTRGTWKPNWDSEGDNLAMQVDYIRVYQRIEA